MFPKIFVDYLKGWLKIIPKLPRKFNVFSQILGNWVKSKNLRGLVVTDVIGNVQPRLALINEKLTTEEAEEIQRG